MFAPAHGMPAPRAHHRPPGPPATPVPGWGDPRELVERACALLEAEAAAWQQRRRDEAPAGGSGR